MNGIRHRVWVKVHERYRVPCSSPSLGVDEEADGYRPPDTLRFAPVT